MASAVCGVVALMPDRRSSSPTGEHAVRLSWLPDRLPLLAGVVAEAALLAVFAIAITGLSGGIPTFAVPGLALLVALGAFLTRRVRGRWRAPIMAGGAALALSIAVLLPIGLSAGAALDGGLGLAIGGALIGGLAFLRGSVHDDPADDALAADQLLRWGPWLLLLPWAMGMSLDALHRAWFAGPAFAATTLFAASALLAVATSRLRILAADAGIDWRGGRAWSGTLATLLIGILLFLVPASFVLGAPVVVAIGVATAPLFAGAAVVLAGFAAIGGLFAALLQGLFSRMASNPSSTSNGPPEVLHALPGASGDTGLPLIIFTVIGVAIAIVIVALITRHWLRSPQTSPAALLDEHRSTELELHWPRSSWRMPRLGPRHLGAPGDAEAAYLRLLEDYDDDPVLRRNPGETPSEHVARLRQSVGPNLPRDLLAADFELVRFGGMDLGKRENRRAIDRWRRLRESRS